MHGELSAGLVDLEVLVFEQFAETAVVHETLGFGLRNGFGGLFAVLDVGLVLGFRCRFVATLTQHAESFALLVCLLSRGKSLGKPAVDLDGGFLCTSDAAFPFLVDTFLNALLSLLFEQVGVADHASLFVQLLSHEVTVHVWAQQAGLANQVIQVELAKLGDGQEFVVVVDVALGAVGFCVVCVRVVGVFGHFFDHVVEECAPLGRGAELGNEERVLLASLVGSKEHARVRYIFDVVEIHCGFDGCPRVSSLRIPELDNALVGGHDLL